MAPGTNAAIELQDLPDTNGHGRKFLINGKLSDNDSTTTTTSLSKERPNSKLRVDCIGQGETIWSGSFGRIEIEPSCNVKHNPDMKFFQFHFTYYEDEVLLRIIGWFHPQLMDRLKQRHCSIFIDATFRCVPTRFYQLVITMVYDPISDLYLPVWHVLTSGKTSQIYEHIFHYICVASKKQLVPAHIVCDIEFAIIKAVKVQLPDS
ncbi:Hypothetical protein PHPALM_18000 [Phytophthora palmivora]|uniref:MULE transposase domain-containing protein n=1 Tax=Phytophthora palmivora TaxID=4796 RepID=A0A2P4XKV2_9STRA|nr:Hypothetical protein PHPALM_18000 [Phytophthora palmivora]